jgi:DNA-binding NarL/FixJ family response regulator
MSRILIVEDELIVAENIGAILEGEGYEVCGIAMSADEALVLFEEKNPHLVLCDIFIKGSRNGIALAAELRKRTDVPFIFLTAYADRDTVKQASATQPAAYLIKPFAEKQLIAAVDTALLTFYQRDVAADGQMLPEPTRRERDILEWLAKGKGSKQIAEILFLSEHTVQTHLMNLMQKYNTVSSSELVALAIKNKWIQV